MSDETMTPAEQLRQAALQVDALASSGLAVSVDPDVAEFMASFTEEALDEAEAFASTFSIDPKTRVVIVDEHEETVQ